MLRRPGFSRSQAEEIKWSLVDPHDFGALKTKAGHQTLLVESERVDAAMHGIGAEAPCHSLVHDDDARAGADLPPARVVYPIHRFLVHQEEGVTVFLNARLQAIGGGYGPVAAVWLTVHEKNSFAPLRAKDEAGFDYIRENKNGHRSRFTFGSRRILRYELLQRGARLAGQVVGGCCVRAK